MDTDFHNQQVHFPTVTICPMSSFDPDLLNDTAAKSFANDDENFEEIIRVMKSLTKLTYDTFGSTYEAIRNMSNELDINKYDLRQLAFKVGIKCEELLEICRYKDEEISCCEYFFPLYSEHGLCYSFNARYYGSPEEEYASFFIAK